MSEPPPQTASQLARGLSDWLIQRTPEMVAALEALVRVESPSSDPDAQARLFAVLTTLLEELDFHAVHLPGRTSGGLLYARPKTRLRGAPCQLILAHADTVWPAGTLTRMPFRVDAERAHGPGTYDTKAGLVQAVFALHALRDLGHMPSVTPVLLVNSDEEIGSADSTRQVARLARAVERAWVLEPSLGPQGHLKTARKGVGHFTITAHGIAAHAGLDPDKGVSATVEMSHLIQTLHALNDPARGLSVNVGEIRGGTLRNVIPAQAVAEVDVRVRTRADARRIEARIRAITPTLPGARVTLKGGFVKEPLERSPEGDRLWALARSAAGHLGIPLDHGAAGGASDGNTTALYCPTLDGLGAVGDGAHAAHEHVWIAQMPQRAALLALLLLSPSIQQRA